jgi:hypothetical protein
VEAASGASWVAPKEADDRASERWSAIGEREPVR